jgi:hypothetical protein
MPTVGPYKAVAAGSAGTASILIIWLVGQFGVVVPPEVAAAATTLIATLFTWLTPHGGNA